MLAAGPGDRETTVTVPVGVVVAAGAPFEVPDDSAQPPQAEHPSASTTGIIRGIRTRFVLAPDHGFAKRKKPRTT
jgi:hypothetical protein